MDATNLALIIVVVVAALIIGGLLGMVFGRRQRTKRLQEKFGSEYDHTLGEVGDKRQAEHELQSRLEHVKTLEIHPLSAEEVNRFTSEWQATQASFVDE